MRTFTSAASALLCAAGASALSEKYCPSSSSGACYRWGVPDSSNNVYMQITAPSSWQWAALGIGSQMSGADIFLIYKDGSGNVTLSTRHATGHQEPEHTERTDVELLSGSGVEGDTMTANIRCSDCSSLDKTGSNDWIAAWKDTGSLESSSVSADIPQHDGDAQFQVDFSKAQISSDTNPFVEAASGNTGGTSTTGASSPASTSGTDGDGDSNESSGGAVQEGGGAAASNDNILMAHGIVMALAFAVLYPLGATLMAFIGRWFVHAGVQIVAFLLMWAGFGLGYYYSSNEGSFFTDYHMKIGTITVALLGIQPALGLLHHILYKRKGRRTFISHIHIWYGRLLMILGIINGGLGIYLQGEDSTWKITYGVIAGAFGGAYLGAGIWSSIKRRRATVSSPKIKQTESPPMAG